MPGEPLFSRVLRLDELWDSGWTNLILLGLSQIVPPEGHGLLSKFDGIRPFPADSDAVKTHSKTQRIISRPVPSLHNPKMSGTEVLVQALSCLLSYLLSPCFGCIFGDWRGPQSDDALLTQHFRIKSPASFLLC